MLNIIIILVLILVLIIIFNKNKNDVNDNDNDNDNEKFISENKVNYNISRPNCPQLNKPHVCLDTPGCFSTKNGCINNYQELQEQQKEWEKDDFMIIYNY
jgi:hypothetical protein